ncbi:hypothetical protein D3C87_1929720 [compost metagenome]
MAGDDLAIGRDHARHGEKPAVRGDNLQEICHEAADAGLGAEGDNGFQLIFGGKDRACDQALEIDAFVDHGLKAIEIGTD